MKTTLYKTKTVSQELGVNPTTIQRWVKHFDLPCQRNEHGHYLFTDADIVLLKQIKEQLNRGLSMSEVKLHQHEENGKTHSRVLKKEEMINKFDEMVNRMDNIEQKLGNKADDVVTFQILQHRNEIDELVKKLTTLEQEIEQLKEKQQKQAVLMFNDKIKKAPKKRWLASLLSFISQ